VCVDLRGIEPHVAQHGLNVADVGTSFEHQRRHGMPEDVTRHLRIGAAGRHSRLTSSRNATYEVSYAVEMHEGLLSKIDKL
jgi:hypothetical protein